MKTAGRLFQASGSASWNMALDEALLGEAIRNEARMSEDSSPMLRFYNWSAPAITVGRFQDAARCLNLGRCQAEGIAVVRRPTGGRAVYHAADLTYSLVFSEKRCGDLSVRGSYRLISTALARALEATGLQSHEGRSPAPGQQAHADCFAHATVSDLVAGGQKIAGGAQVRRSGYVLQQGSIRLFSTEAPAGVFAVPARTSTDALEYVAAEQNLPAQVRLGRSLALPPEPCAFVTPPPRGGGGGAGGEGVNRLGRNLALPTNAGHPIHPSSFILHPSDGTLDTARETLAHHFAAELAGVFSCEWQPVELSGQITARAVELERRKYSQDSWNLEGKEIL